MRRFGAAFSLCLWLACGGERTRPAPIEPVEPAPVAERAPIAAVAAEPSGPIRVTLVVGRGVTAAARDSATAALGDDARVALSIVTHPEVATGALDQADVVLFTGGRGGIQGEALGDEGRARVRTFVEHGGGYVGICAGSYLAIQGPAEFFKVGIVAAVNATGDDWQRGSSDLPVRMEDGNALSDERTVVLHYENGPIFAAQTVEGLAPYRTLGAFAAEIAMPERGTHPGEMIDRPAIIEATYGEGHIVLFSPNPVLGAHPRPDMLIAAIEHVAR